ncbi:MAG TPA: alpha-2-macroglobulin family protein [Gammaproteobacteria bacterium]|nr:alpha-2-macroglobulin family protein [Gammaproteobacteria bacterium]
MSRRPGGTWQHWLRGVAMTLAVAAGAAGTAAAPAAVPTQLPPPATVVRPAGTDIIPERFLRRWDPVTIFFDSDVGPDRPGPEDHPERYVRMQPAHPGAFTWLNPRTLQFRPAEPWPPLTRFTWKADGARRVLATLMEPPRKTEPANGADGLAPVDSITLTFAEPLDTAALARMVNIELKPLPGVGEGSGRSRWLSADDFHIKVVERQRRSDPASYVLLLKEPIASGTRAIVHLRLSLDDSVDQAFKRIRFATAEPFRVLSLGCTRNRFPVTPQGVRYTREQAIQCGADRRSVQLEFSAEPGKLGPVEARNLVRFTPAVKDLSFSHMGRTLGISGKFASDTLYRVTLMPSALTDRHGRPLQMRAPSEVYLYFPPRHSFLDWTSSQGVMERYGPQTVPLKGRGFQRVDLRIYPIDPLDRSFWPFPERPVAVDESQRPPGPGEAPDAFDEPGRYISARELAAQISALGSPAISQLVKLPLYRAGAAATFGLDIKDYLARIHGKGRPGTYLVGVRRLDDSTTRSWIRVQVTDLSLTAAEENTDVQFYVTSLRSGEPVEDAQILLQGVRDHTWVTVTKGTTDDNGAYRWHAPGRVGWRGYTQVRRIVVRKGEDVLVLNPTRAPDRYQDNHWGASTDTWLQWALRPLDARVTKQKTLCHLFTERPVYRPDEPVHIEGYVRQRRNNRFSIARPDGYLVVQGPGDREWRYPLAVDSAGTLYHKFEEKKLPTGTFSAYLDLGKQGHCGKVQFQKQAYRTPRFQVSLHGPDITSLDKPFKVGLTAKYYAGGRVSKRPVRWRVTQFPYTWTPKKREGYYYSSDGRFSGRKSFRSSPVLERAGTTDEDGGASISLNPAIEPTAQPRSYVVEATVVGADDQTVTDTRRVVALPPLVLGLKVPRYLKQANSIEPKIMVVGPDGKLIAGQSVTVRLLRRQWHSHLEAADFSQGSAKYVTDVVDEKVLEKKVTSGKDPITAHLPIDRAGVYIVEIEAHDRLGRAQVVSVDLYAGGKQPVTWSRPPTKVFKVSTDRKRYRPGQTAHLVLESPFQEARALAIVETPEGNRYHWIDVDDGAATFALPIDKRFTPRVPVHFILMRGRLKDVPKDEGGVDLGKPTTVAATQWVEVEPVANRVQVKLDYPKRAQPGDELAVTVKLSDPDGHPLAGQASLWLVDQAVLALGREQRLDPLPDFIASPQSHLVLRDTRNLVFGRIPFEEQPGGGEAAMAAERKNLLDRVTVRRNFQPVPYFNPTIAVGPSGTARVKVKLPDNLTNFKLRAKAVSGAERFGFAKGEIAVRLPVIVQPSLPRFLRPGDRFTATAIGRVVEGKGGAGRAVFKVEGATLEGKPVQHFKWSTGTPQHLDFQVKVPTPKYTADGQPSRTEVGFTAAVERSADKARDAFQVKLPLRPDRAPVTRRVLRRLMPGEKLSWPKVAEPARTGTLRRSVLLSDQPGLVRMSAGFDYLLHYPHGCTEQRIARARAFLALRRFRALLSDASVSDAKMQAAVNGTLKWIAGAVDDHGLVGYWPGSRGYVSLTSWAVLFMNEARKAGYPINEDLYGRLVGSLRQALRSDYGHFITGEAYAERTMALWALTDAGKGDPAYAAELARKADYLSLENLAEVERVLRTEGSLEPTTLAKLDKRIREGIVFRLYQGHEIYGGLQEKASGRNALILPSETRTLAEVLRTWAQADPGAPRVQRLVDALVTLGGTGGGAAGGGPADGWGSTNANVSAMLALSEFVGADASTIAASEDSASDQSVTLTLDGKSRQVRFGPGHRLVKLSTGAGAGEAAAAKTGAKDARPVAVRVQTRYVPVADGGRVEPATDGFVVNRELLRVRGEGEPLARTAIDKGGRTFDLKVGDVVEDHVEVVNGQDRTYVAVVVPLAAGMEPLNPHLATAPPEAKPKGELTLSPSYVAYLDDRVAFYYDSLPKGNYHFYFRTRASIPGRFIQPAAHAEMMYDQAVNGHSAGAYLAIGTNDAKP